MIMFSVFVFKQPLTIMSCIGCIITISGSFWYFFGIYSLYNTIISCVEKSKVNEKGNMILDDDEVNEKQSLV